MTTLLDASALVYGVNAVFFGSLAYVYGRTAYSTRARYPIGLFIFSVVLLLQSAGTALAYVFLSPYFGDEAVPYMLVMGTFELAGVLALLKITV